MGVLERVSPYICYWEELMKNQKKIKLGKLNFFVIDDNYIKYGDLMYPSDILEMISSNRRTDRKKDKKVKYKLNIEEIFERADKSKIEFQENLEIIKEYLNSIKDFIKDNNSKYRNIYYDTKNEIDELYPKFQEAVKKYNNIKTQIENLLNQAKKIN